MELGTPRPDLFDSRGTAHNPRAPRSPVETGAILVSMVGGLAILGGGLLLLISYASCLAGCINPGGPGLSPGEPAPAPAFGPWLTFGLAQALIGGLMLGATAVLWARRRGHVSLGLAVLGASAVSAVLSLLAPSLAPPVGFLVGMVGGALAIASSPRTRRVSTTGVGGPRSPRSSP